MGRSIISKSLTDLPTAYWRVCTRCKFEKSEEMKYSLQVNAQERTVGDKKYDYCRLKLMPKDISSKKRKDSHFKARNRDEERLAIGAPRRGKAKGTGKENAKKNAKRGACIRLDHKRPMFIWRSMRIQSKTRTRKAKGRDDFVHLLRQVHRTEIRKVTEKVAMTAEVLKAHQHLLAHVREDSEQTTLYKLQERKLPERKLV